MDISDKYIYKKNSDQQGFWASIRDRDDSYDEGFRLKLNHVNELLWMMLPSILEDGLHAANWDDISEELGLTTIHNNMEAMKSLMSFLHSKYTKEKEITNFAYSWERFYGRQDMLFQLSLQFIEEVRKDATYDINYTILESMLRKTIAHLWELLKYAAFHNRVEILDYLPMQDIKEGFLSDFAWWEKLHERYTIVQLFQTLEQHALLDVPMSINDDVIQLGQEEILVL